uniref:Aldehyde dehydrogenase domain-containing protein n=1 Tax=Malurus cyaneus samueli TaxID=2593467 RepID=A0A8C5X2T3_9PASS
RNPHAGLVSHLWASWLSGKTWPVEYHVAQLEALGHFLDVKKQDILEATELDLGKPPFEAKLSEIFLCKNELHETLNNLSRWMKDERWDSTNLPVPWPASAGVSPGVSSPDGLAVTLSLLQHPVCLPPGNCVIVKPSEVSKKTERLVAEALPVYLDKDCFAVVTGGMQETTRLLENKFDYIFFSGSPPVGQIVMTAAAKHLTATKVCLWSRKRGEEVRHHLGDPRICSEGSLEHTQEHPVSEMGDVCQVQVPIYLLCSLPVCEPGPGADRQRWLCWQ